MVGAVYRKSLRLSNSARKKFTVGEITNFMAVDAQRLVDSVPMVHFLWSSAYVIILALAFLYLELGVSAFAGLGVLLLLIPANVWGGKKGEELQDKQMEKKDERIKIMTEILNGIKVIKLYAWENFFMKQIETIRNSELKILKVFAKLTALANFTYSCSPFFVTLTVFAIYVSIDASHVLTADKIFVSIALFNIMRLPLVMFPWALIESIKLFVSISRLNSFLNAEELDEER